LSDNYGLDNNILEYNIESVSVQLNHLNFSGAYAMIAQWLTMKYGGASMKQLYENKVRPVNVCLPDKLMERVDQAAKDAHRSRSAIVREALEQYCGNYAERQSESVRQERYRQTMQETIACLRSQDAMKAQRQEQEKEKRRQNDLARLERDHAMLKHCVDSFR